jgi:hypothetical protein
VVLKPAACYGAPHNSTLALKMNAGRRIFIAMALCPLACMQADALAGPATLAGDWAGRPIAAGCMTINNLRMRSWHCETKKALGPACQFRISEKKDGLYLLDFTSLASRRTAKCGAFAVVDLDYGGNSLTFRGCISRADRQNYLDGKDNFCSSAAFERIER